MEPHGAGVMRSIPSGMKAGVVARIDETLRALAEQERVAIPLAIESGSRAWGFPSPDSDYDCRFIFVRPLAQVVSLWPRRDVIEAPLDRELDLNGWDLGKAVKLLVNGNAVVIEWLTSPIVYRGDPAFRDGLLELARKIADRCLIGRHYLHLGERQRRTYFADTKTVPQKKIFYALRPAMALRWLRLHPGEAIAPMHFPTLMVESELPGEVTAVTSDLMTRKALTRELGIEPLSPLLAAFIDGEFQKARTSFDQDFVRIAEDGRQAADEFFRETVRRFDS